MNGALAGHPLRWAVPPAAHALRSRALPPSPRLHPPLHTHSQSPPLPAPSTPPSASRPCALPAGPGGAPLDGHVDAALHHAVEGDLHVPHLLMYGPKKLWKCYRSIDSQLESLRRSPSRSTGTSTCRTCPRPGAPLRFHGFFASAPSFQSPMRLPRGRRAAPARATVRRPSLR